MQVYQSHGRHLLDFYHGQVWSTKARVRLSECCGGHAICCWRTLLHWSDERQRSGRYRYCQSLFQIWLISMKG